METQKDLFHHVFFILFELWTVTAFLFYFDGAFFLLCSEPSFPPLRETLITCLQSVWVLNDENYRVCGYCRVYLSMLPNFFQVTPNTVSILKPLGVDIYFGLAQKNSSMSEEAAFRWESGQEQNVSGSGWSGKGLVTREEMRMFSRETLQLQRPLWQTWNFFNLAFHLLP